MNGTPHVEIEHCKWCCYPHVAEEPVCTEGFTDELSRAVQKKKGHCGQTVYVSHQQLFNRRCSEYASTGTRQAETVVYF